MQITSRTILFLLISMLTLQARAQVKGDNPNLDQMPWYLAGSPNGMTDVPLSSVVTVDNWDNFTLGVDFAENNMAVHPSQPTWFFTAYNTNGTHHTENGIDWAVNNPTFGATMMGDPVVAYDSLGNLFYENMYGSSGNVSGCKVVSSTTNGATWGTSVTSIAGNDKNWIACDQTAGPYANYVYTTMTNSTAGNFARSTNHGVSFTPTFAPATQSLPGMMVCVGPQGTIQGGAVYVVTNSGSSFASVYTFYRSTNGGTSFTQQSSVQWSNYVGTNVSSRNSVQNMRTRPYPMITADNSYGPFRGRLYCVYASNTPSGSGNKPDIFCRYSSNGGVSWSSAVVVNDDPGTTANHQWHPSVWCDKETGRLYVMWMDTRDTPTSDSAFIYAAYSTTGGASFSANQRISNVKMKIDCPTCGGGGTPRYQGDYNGVVSNKKTSMIGWTDFRSGTFQSMTAYFPDFAMSLDHTSHTLYTATDSATFQVSVPTVKLYTDTVAISAIISPSPTIGSLSVSFPSGNQLTAFPGSRPVRIRLWGAVPAGTYTVTFTAAGPNGTPVHRRTATLTVVAGSNLQASVTLQPDRQVCAGDTVHVPIRVTGSNIHGMSFYISYDTSVLMQPAPYYCSAHPAMAVSCYPAPVNSNTLSAGLTLPGTSVITLSNSTVIELIFLAKAPGIASVHLRRPPDPAPLSVITDGGGVLFSQVGYTDNTVTSVAGSPVSVTLSAIPALPVCDGTPISIAAAVVNGGTSPGYQWWLNGMATGAGEPQFSFTPESGDEISCTVTSSATCAISNPATAPPLAQMTIPRQLPAVCILPSSNPVPSGVPVTFTVSTTGGGSAPLFNWFVNSVSAGTMGPQFTYVPSDHDTVICTMTSNALCLMGSPVVSSQVIMTVLASSQVQQLENISIDDTRCFGAPQAIIVAGDGTTAAFLPESEVTLVSGQNIYFMPSTQILAGAWLDAYISTDGILCQQPTRPLVSPAEISGTASGKAGPTGVRVYPNPASDRIFIQITGPAAGESAELEVYGSTGALVSHSRLETGKVFDQSVATWSPGLYQLRVICRGSILTSRLLISRP